MSAIDVLNSFAQSREQDEALIRDGISYGAVREVVRELSAMRGGTTKPLAHETGLTVNGQGREPNR